MMVDALAMDGIEEVVCYEFSDEPSTSQGNARRRPVRTSTSVDPSLDLGADLELFPEFKNVLTENDSLDGDSEGCPLPGTPEEESLMDPKEQELCRRAEEFMHKVWEGVQSWNVQPFSKLPRWLQDNDYLHDWHRPPLPSFSACFKSIFRIHTETGNIWTHLLGCVAFIGLTVYFMCTPSDDLETKLVFTTFLVGAILCLGLSTTFHTVSCHSEFVGKLFCKFDYCGIAFLIMGSFVPWLYYGFYCEFKHKLIYLTSVFVLGVSTIVVSLWDKFSTPVYRPLRTSVFLVFGLSGIIPAVHYTVREGLDVALSRAALGPLALMGVLYVLGAVFYAVRVPERWFPGKCDLWFHSHQIFHTLVVAAAFVHYHGISRMAMYRRAHGQCTELEEDVVSSDTLYYAEHI
ncbi:AdipoR/hemolysin-III-related [Trinorchestia longiramus]|nr:AdipoR/hemolysin-III-related [Trinorchestia longiramus]